MSCLKAQGKTIPSKSIYSKVGIESLVSITKLCSSCHVSEVCKRHPSIQTGKGLGADWYWAQSSRNG